MVLLVMLSALLVGSPLYPEPGQGPGSCATTTKTYVEDFSISHVDPLHSSPSYLHQPNFVALGNRSGGFSTSPLTKYLNFQPNKNQRIYALAAADFNGDGTDDLIVGTSLEELYFESGIGMGQYTGGVDLYFFANSPGGFNPSLYMGPGFGRFQTVFTVGDFNGDGKPDLVTAGSDSVNGYAINQTRVYINNSSGGTVSFFSPYDVSDLLINDAVVWHIGGNQMAATDFNGDGIDDLLVFSSNDFSSRVLMYPGTNAGIKPASGTVVINDAKLAYPIAGKTTPAPVGFACMPDIGLSVGGTVVLPADFNNDGLVDLVLGSGSERRLQFFNQNAAHIMVPQPDLPLTVGGAQFGFVRDIDQDGSPDLIYVRGGALCDGNPGEAYILFGSSTGAFTSLGLHYGFGHSVSFASVLNYDDSNHAGTFDLLGGRHNVVGRHVVYLNQQAANIYNLTSKVTSKALAPQLDSTTQSITDATVLTFTRAVPATTTLKLQLTNDGGQHWDTLVDDELPPKSQVHSFTHFGTDLRWRLLLTAPAAQLTASEQIFAPGAKLTPKVTGLTLNYSIVNSNLYSRSSNASLSLGTVSAPQDSLFAAEFAFPGNLGNLIAYNLSQSPTATAASTNRLSDVSPSASTPILWDAGALLQASPGSGRLAYLTQPQATLPTPLTDTVTYATRLRQGSDSTMASVAAASTAYANQLNAPASTTAATPGLLSFIQGGFGEPTQWKLRDPGHASPVAVKAPSGDPNYLQNGYAQFQAAQAGRRAVVYQGANDGMLHAFDAKTGAELWGLVPFNLFNAFVSQASVDATGSFSYRHQMSVDGSPTVSDIYVNGSWRTVLIGAQGQGVGLGATGYYYALDVTNPLAPVALWEFSDVLTHQSSLCDASQNCTTTCTPTCTPVPSTCAPECSTYDSYFLTASAPGGIATSLFDDIFYLSQAQSESGLEGTGIEYSFYAPRAGNYDFYLHAQLIPPSPFFCITSNLDYISVFRDKYIFNAAPKRWVKLGTTFVSAGEHTFMYAGCGAGGEGDYIRIQPSSLPAPLDNDIGLITCIDRCDSTCTVACQSDCVDPNKNVAWPQCGINANQQCCGAVGTDQYCAPVGSCGAPEPSQGQTIAPPAIGRLAGGSTGVWAAFFGSGYNPGQAPNVGRSIYAVNALTGALIQRWDVGDIAGPNSANLSSIDNTLPGGVSLVDVDGDGYVDRAYLGDLEGRLWKIDLSAPLTGTTAKPNQYPLCVLFDAADPQQSGGQRIWAPIVTKPAVAVISSGFPNVYFGTGGDDRAPSDQQYKFYAVRDTDAPGQCRSFPIIERNLSIANGEWVMGDGRDNTLAKQPLAPPVAASEGLPGERYWADPLIVNNTTIYFSSLPGSIESVNPCSGGSLSKIYAYALTNFTDASGTAQIAGTSILTATPYLVAAGKVRRSATLRGGNPDGPARAPSKSPIGSVAPTDIFFQSYSNLSSSTGPTIQRLSSVGIRTTAHAMRLLRWREIAR